MSYQTFANPKGSYQGSQPNAAPTYLATPQQIVPPPIGEEGKFIEKKIYDGVGKFHGNHFRGYFSYITNPSPKQILAANQHFFDNFCSIFSVSNVAKASTGKYKFKSKNTIEFQLGGTIDELANFYSYLPNIDRLTGEYHSDWVSIEKETDNLSCYASTLKREWIIKKEHELFSSIAKIATSSKIVKTKEAELRDNLIEVNQHHFLAGRRSWAIGYDSSVNLWFIETVAFERNSVCEFSLLDKYGNLRQTVIDLWINQINNYFSVIKKTNNLIISPLHSSIPSPIATISGIPAKVNGKVINEYADYNYSRNVLYKVAEENVGSNLLNTPWFKNCLQRHTGLTKGL